MVVLLSSGVRARALYSSEADERRPRSIADLQVGGTPYCAAVSDWNELRQRAADRYEDGVARLPDDPDARQRQRPGMGRAAGAAGLAELMSGRDGREWFARAAERYRESWDIAPPESWGRP